MENYIELFQSELEEYTKQLNTQLLNLEAHNNDVNAILEVFRIFHTLKGMSQTMGYDSLAEVCHAIEDVLLEPKEKGMMSTALIDFLLSVADYLTNVVQNLKRKESLPPVRDILDSVRALKEKRESRLTRRAVQTIGMDEVRVKLEKLDALFTVANELMIAKSRIQAMSRRLGDARLLELSETASRLIVLLQDEVMRLRMLPLATVFEFFPRWIRDESKRQNKDIDFHMSGGDIEIDRSLIDIFKELLVHILRNAVDHAFEPHRKKKGTIRLIAEREKEWIQVSAIDNGKGIDPEHIRKHAYEKGLITRHEAKRLSTAELFRFLIRPDFTTKEQTSMTSGRGIGLDIVNSTVTRLGGRLIIASAKDEGARFTIELPISLAILRALIISVDSQRYALPMSYVRETFHISDDMVRELYHHELYPVRREILPLVRLSERLNCPRTASQKSVIVIQHQERRYGYIADSIIEENDIVVKKIDTLLAHPFYSGCSIYTDGLPIMILDPRGFV